MISIPDVNEPSMKKTLSLIAALAVPEFLQGIDVLLFFLGWQREEAWARSAAEALMSGCPVITTNRGGNRDQVIHGNTVTVLLLISECICRASRAAKVSSRF